MTTHDSNAVAVPAPSAFPWQQAGWREDVEAWIKEYIPMTEPLVELQQRPTGCVYRMGEWYFKAVIAPFTHEPAVTRFLARHFPDSVPQVAAINPDKGWILQRDGGVTLKSITQAERSLSRWEPILAAYAGLQLASVAWEDTMLALGLPDRRLHLLPDLFDRLAHDDSLLSAEQNPDGIPDDERAAMRKMRPEVERLAQQLASYNIPATLHHDDFHAGNIVVNDSAFGIIDWGESFIAHPFYSLFMIMRYAAYMLELPPDDPAMIRLRDSYLNVWTGHEPMPRLIEAYALAGRFQKLNRALTWHTYVSSLPVELRADDAGSAEYWLREFVSDPTGATQ